MRRGDLVSAVLPGDYGSKPRPALVIQSDMFSHLDSVTIVPLTTTVEEMRITRVTIEPSAYNHLLERSQIMVDKPHTLRRQKIGYVFGRIDEMDLAAVDRALALFLGLS